MRSKSCFLFGTGVEHRHTVVFCLVRVFDYFLLCFCDVRRIILAVLIISFCCFPVIGRFCIVVFGFSISRIFLLWRRFCIYGYDSITAINPRYKPRFAQNGVDFSISKYSKESKSLNSERVYISGREWIYTDANRQDFRYFVKSRKNEGSATNMWDIETDKWEVETPVCSPTKNRCHF